MRRSFLSSKTERPRSGGGWYILYFRKRSASVGRLGGFSSREEGKSREMEKTRAASRGFGVLRDRSGYWRRLPLSILPAAGSRVAASFTCIITAMPGRE